MSYKYRVMILFNNVMNQRFRYYQLMFIMRLASIHDAFFI